MLQLYGNSICKPQELIFKQSMESCSFLSEFISPNQSGFKPGDSCINQLLAITHEIWKSFDKDVQVRGIFLHLSKAFDKVWHEGLVFKLKQNVISGILLNLLYDFLRNRKVFTK